jgi:hypothetical protein
MSVEPYTPPVDPGGGGKTATQRGSTAASALGFVALVGSGAGDQVTAALGLGAHTPQILSAGFAFAGMGSSSLFTTGLILVGLGIILNLISLGLGSRQPPDRAVTTYTPAAPNPNPSVVSPEHRP